MALQVYHNRAENTHENEQFRRITKGLIALFDKMNWDGLLIGNPSNPDFRRFKADAILYYNNGLLIIDLKDYAGDIKLPPNSQEFRITKWYIDTEKDSKRIEIKGGSKFINPFKQLESYRGSLVELIKSNLILKEKINCTKIWAVNIFSGPIKLNKETPRDIPYYRIVQETDFQTFLYDFASPTSYYQSIADEFKRIFPSVPWLEKLSFKSVPETKSLYHNLVDENFITIVTNFIQHPDNQILLLESGDTKKRDEWMHYLYTNATNYSIPQVDVWAHSTRIARRIKTRTGIEPHSLFSTIYGGNEEITMDTEKQENNSSNGTIPTQDTVEQVQDIIGIRNDKELDDKALIILTEAHLVTRSLYQTELLRFGTGRLLEDMFTFIKLANTKRKLICIGDPYSLSYGDVDESAISTETISILFKGEVIKYRDKGDYGQETSLSIIKSQILTSINRNLFNNLYYDWDNKTLFEVDKSQAEGLFHKWFKYPNDKEPDYAVLVFKNKDALKISQWIRKNVQNKTADYVQGDLLLANNSFNIPDETGLAYPQRIQNGMYLRVEELLDRYHESITPTGRKPVLLKFVYLKVTCLSNTPPFQANIWIIENYINNTYELTLEEQIAFRVFISKRVTDYLTKNSFEKSVPYKNLFDLQEYKDALKKQKELQAELEIGHKVKTKLEEVGVQIRKLEREAKNRHKQNAMIDLLNSDPLVNAALVQYGYSMNVHKALGSTFKEIVFNVFQGENFGITTEGYFRWLYTGLSCGVNSVKIINPLPINSLMNCVFEDTDKITPHSSYAKEKTHMEFTDIDIPDEIKNTIPVEIPENVKLGIVHLIQKLQPFGYVFDKAIFVQYAVKVIFTTPTGSELADKNKLFMVVHYNSKNTVTSIRIEKDGKAERSIIEKCIKELGKPIDLPNDWRGYTYKKWTQLCGKAGYEFIILEEHNNQTVIKITSNKKSAKIRIWYLNNGFFSKIIVLEKSETEFGNELKEILLNAYQA